MGSHALKAGAHRRRRLDPQLRRRLTHAVTGAFIVLVAWLVFDRARKVDWSSVGEALAAYPAATLAAAVGLAAASHLCYACYELLGRAYARHRLPTRSVLGVGLVSYAFNLNLGSLVGGFAFRWRLYSRLGLRRGQIGRIIGLSLVTNWSGYLLLAGLVLAMRTIELPPPVTVGTKALQGLGVAMVAAVLGYLAWCALATRRDLHLRGHHFRLPGARMALAQVALSSLNWSLIGLIVWVLLPPGVDYRTTLATLLVAGIAGVITHVPGGLGVIEYVFVTVLAGRVAEGPLVAALLAYRAVYYLLPLAVAAGLHFLFEASARRRAAKRAAAP